ncbi:MAG: hypothetical protein JWQ55_6109, partial [Rhodopila sp.]|nr:hypothetical protein [Rhodopila sp.]
SGSLGSPFGPPPCIASTTTPERNVRERRVFTLMRDDVHTA